MSILISMITELSKSAVFNISLVYYVEGKYFLPVYFSMYLKT